MQEGINQGGAEKLIYEISILDTTKLSIFQKLIRGERIVFVVYEGKIVISGDGLHTTITKNLGIQENNEIFISGNLRKVKDKTLCIITKGKGLKRKDIDDEPEGINIKTQLSDWLGLKFQQAYEFLS